VAQCCRAFGGFSTQVLSLKLWPGALGEQYLPYADHTIREMYQVANYPEGLDDKEVQADPLAMLFRSVKDKKKFVIYVAKFGEFIKEVALLYLQLAKQYFPDEMLIPMIGKQEYVNISEFRKTGDVQLQITVKPMADDVNTMMGKQLSIQHALQYVGPNLKPDQVGHMIRQLPFANFDEAFSDMTLDYDSATNMILALERGEESAPSLQDTKEYMVKRLDKRMRESDFKMLAPQIQQNFLQTKKIYEQMIAEELKKLQAAQQGFIPTEGALIKTDMQVQMPNSTGGMKTTRAAFPYKALEWLDMKLKDQGMAQERLQSELSQGSMAEVSDLLSTGHKPANVSPPTGMGAPGGMLV
jgi:hypothetical protein